MVNAAAFEADRVALELARELPADSRDDFLRLARSLVHGPAFQWLLVEAPSERLRKRVMNAISKVLRKAGLSDDQLILSRRIEDVAALEDRLASHARKCEVVHVLGQPGWFNAERWDAFNARRERIAATAAARLVFWLDAEAIVEASRSAPDLWAWRSGVYAFTEPASGLAGGPSMARAMPRPTPWGEALRSRSMPARQRRIAEIQDWLRSEPDAPDDLKVGPLDELGQLLFDAGEYDAALKHLQSIELPFHHRRGDERAVAITQGKMADILRTRGQLDEALHLLQEDGLPVFERLGDLRGKAVTMGKIADILHARGQFDEALRILQDEAVPVFERLGEVRNKAVAVGKIAEILKARGRLDEALRILRDQGLPVFERLGDVRGKAVTMGHIAGILQARGQFDEALGILQQELLPVFERLGDLREKAATMDKIADILQARGQLDEALRIRRDDVLPVVERLGDVRGRALTKWKLALGRLDRNELDRQTAGTQLDEAYRALAAVGLPEAKVLARQMLERGFTPPV